MAGHRSRISGISRRRFLELASISGLGMATAACGLGASGTPAASAATATTPKRGGTLTILVAESISGVDTFRDGGTPAGAAWHQLYDSLLMVDPSQDYKIIPALAESLPEIKDPVTYIFRLRKGVKFHDGTDFDADSVMWQYGTALKDPAGWLGGLITPFVKSVEKVDQFTVRMNLVQPSYDVLNFMAMGYAYLIQSKAATEKLGKDYGFKDAAGTGPFTFGEFPQGAELVMNRNASYWDKAAGLPYLDKIVVRTVADASSSLLQLQTGAVDVLYQVPASSLDALKATKGVVVTSTPGGTTHYMSMLPYEGSPFRDVRVRQAMYYAIDRQEIVDKVLLGQAVVAKGIFPPTLFIAQDRELYPFNPEKAKQLLKDAGFDSAKPLRFTLHTSNVAPFTDEAVLIQSQLAKIGVTMKIEQLERAAISRSISLPPAEGVAQRQAILFRAGLDGLITKDYSYRFWHSKGSANRFYNKPGGIMNPAMEKLLEDMAPLTDKEQLKAAAAKVNDTLLSDAPQVFLAYQSNIIAYRDYVRGLKPWSGIRVPLRTVWLDK